jgi:hypothetical protein
VSIAGTWVEGFADGRYANAAIGPVNAILKGYIYPDAFVGTQNGALISSMAFAGIIIGQLSMSTDLQI